MTTFRLPFLPGLGQKGFVLHECHREGRSLPVDFHAGGLCRPRGFRAGFLLTFLPPSGLADLLFAVTASASCS